MSFAFAVKPPEGYRRRSSASSISSACPEEIDDIYKNLENDEIALAWRVNKKIRKFGFAPNSADLNKFIDLHAEVLYIRFVAKGYKGIMTAFFLDDNPRRWVRGASLQSDMLMADSEMDKWSNRCDLKDAQIEEAYDDYDDLCEEMGCSIDQLEAKREKEKLENREKKRLTRKKLNAANLKLGLKMAEKYDVEADTEILDNVWKGVLRRADELDAMCGENEGTGPDAGQEESKVNARPGSTGSLELSASNAGYAASAEGTAGAALTLYSRPRDASASPGSARSSLSNGSNSAEGVARHWRVSLMDYVVPEWNPLAATGPPSVDTGYAASAGRVAGGSLSADNSSRSSEVSRQTSVGDPSGGVTPDTGGVTPNNTISLAELADNLELSTSSSDSSSWIGPWLAAHSSVGNRSRSGSGSSVAGVARSFNPPSSAPPLSASSRRSGSSSSSNPLEWDPGNRSSLEPKEGKVSIDPAISVSPLRRPSRRSGSSCSPRRLTGTSAHEEDGPVFSVTRLPLAPLAASTEPSRRPSVASDGPVSAENGLLLRPSSCSSSYSNPLEWDPGNRSSLEPKAGKTPVDPSISVSPLSNSAGRFMSLDAGHTPRCVQLDRSMAGQASPDRDSGSFGRRYSPPPWSPATSSSASPRVRDRDEGRESTAKKSSPTDEIISLDERPPFSGSSLAGSSLASERSGRVRHSLPSPESASWLVEDDDFNSTGRASFQAQPPRLTLLTLSGMGDSTGRLLSAGVGSPRSLDSLEIERFSGALVSATSSTFWRYARGESGQSLASSGSRSSCYGGCCPRRSGRRTSFTLSVSATPWRSLVDHDESPSPAGSSSPVGSRIVYASHGQARDKPSRLAQERSLPDDDRQTMSIAGNEEGKGPCPDAVLSPVVDQGVTNMVSTSRKDLTSPATADDRPVRSSIGSDEGRCSCPNAVLSPGLEQGVTEMMPTSREDLPSPATADDRPGRSTIGSDEGKDLCLDATLSPVLEQGVTNMVSLSREDLLSPATADDRSARSSIGSDEGMGPCPDAALSPILEQGVIDMVSTSREDSPSPTADDRFAGSTIGSDEGKGPCPCATISPSLAQSKKDMVSTLREDLPSCSEQGVTDMVSTSQEDLPSPVECRRVEHEGSSVELESPSKTSELEGQVIDDVVLTSRSDEPLPPGDPLSDDCSVAAIAGNNNSEIESAGALSSPSFSVAEVTEANAVFSAARARSRAQGGRGLRFGDSPSVSPRRSSDSSWSLTKYVANDGSDSSWSLTKGIASGEVDVPAGNIRNPESPVSELSFRMTLEHGTIPSTEGSVGPPGDSDTNSAPTPATPNADSATEGADKHRIIPASSQPSAFKSGSSDGRSSARGQNVDQSERSGKVAGKSPILGSTMSEPAREIARATPNIAGKTTSCARLHFGYPPSVSESCTTPHRERPSNTRCSPAQSACSDASMRQRSSPSSSTRQTPSSSSGGDGRGSTQSINKMPGTVVPGKKITTGVSRASRGRIERESSASQRSSSTPSARTSAGDTRSKSCKHKGGVPPAVCSAGVARSSSTSRAKSSPTLQSRTPSLAPAPVQTSAKSSSTLQKHRTPPLAVGTVRPSQSSASSATSSSTSSARLRVSGQHSGEPTKSAPALCTAPAEVDVTINSSNHSAQRSNRISAESHHSAQRSNRVSAESHPSTQRSNRISAEDEGTAPRRNGSQRSSRASRLTSPSAPAGEPRSGEVSKSTSVPRRSKIEVKTTKASRSRSLAIQSRLATSTMPPAPQAHSRVRVNRSSCPSPSSFAVGKHSEKKNRLQKSTGLTRTGAPSLREPKDVLQTPVFLSTACASTAGSVAAVSPEEGRMSISGCSGVSEGSRRQEDNAPQGSAGGGSVPVSENRGARGAGITRSASNPPRQLTTTSDKSGRQEGSFRGDSECGSGESIGDSGGRRTGEYVLADFGDSRVGGVGLGSEDAQGELSSISSDHRASSIEPVGDLIQSFSGAASSDQILWEQPDADADSAAASVPSVPPSRPSYPARDRTQGREMVESDAPCAKLAEWRPGAYPNLCLNVNTSPGGQQPRPGVVESKNGGQSELSAADDASLESSALEVAINRASAAVSETIDLKERLRQSEAARGVYSTGFDTPMSEVHAQLASIEAARAEEQKGDPQRTSSSNATADRAISELAAAKKCWAYERQALTTTVTGLREAATETEELLDSAKEVMILERERLRKREKALAAASKRFDTRMAEAKAQLASSEAARAEEQKRSAQRISSLNDEADNAISELVAAKKAWADERQEMNTTMTGLKKDAAEYMEHLECAEKAMTMHRERLRQGEEARAADSTEFHTRMAEVNAQLASSETARAEEQRHSAQRASSLNEKADHAIGELVAAKKAWADERQEMNTTMIGLKEDAAECMQHVESAEMAMALQREHLRQSEEARAADSTGFHTRMAEVNAQLASSEAAWAEEQKGSAQRTSSSNERADRAISELVAAKQSWGDERRDMATIMTGLRADATECMDRLESAKDAMVTQKVAADERASTADTKAAGLEANVACLEANVAYLEKDLAGCKRAERTSLARESTLQNEVAGLRNLAAEKRALEIDREAAFARERGLQAAANDAIAAERAAWDLERETSLQRQVKLEEEAFVSNTRELSARKTTRAVQAEAEMSALAEKHALAAASELEISLVKSRRALLAEQAAASARSSTVEKEHVSQLRDVYKRLTLCEAARKEEQQEAALALSISEEKVTQTIEQLVVAEDARCAERNEMAARFAAFQEESANESKQREASGEETMRTLKAVVHQREANLRAELANMRERLAGAEGRFDSEHAENTRQASRLQTLGRETNALRQCLAEAEETQVTQRTTAAEDLRVVHAELGKLQTRADRENQTNNKLEARFTKLERIQCDKQKELALQAVTLATLEKERDTANALLRDQENAHAEERRTTAGEMSALKKVLNGLRRIELAEQRSMQVDRFATPAPQQSSAPRRERIQVEQGLPPDEYARSTQRVPRITEEPNLATGAERQSFQETRSVCASGELFSATFSSVKLLDPDTRSDHSMAPQRSFELCREAIHLDQGLLPEESSRSTQQVPATENEPDLATGADFKRFQGKNSVCSRSESSSVTISSVNNIDPGTRSAGNHAMAPQRSSVSRRELTHLKQGLLPDDSRNTEEIPVATEESVLAAGAEDESFEETRSACTKGGSSSATFSSVRSSDPGTSYAENHAMEPQRSSASRRARTYLDRGLPPDNYSRNTEHVPASEEESGIASGAEHERSRGTRLACTRGGSSSESVSPSLVSGNGLRSTPGTTKTSRATVRPGEVRLGRDRWRPHEAERTSTTRNEDLSSLNDRWLGQNTAEAPESAGAENTVRNGQCAGNRRTVGAGFLSSDGHSPSTRHGKDVVNVDRFQDKGRSRGSVSRTPAPRNPNQCYRSGQGRLMKSRMREVSGGLEGVNELPGSAREQGAERFDARELRPRSQREASLLATQILVENAGCERKTTGAATLAEGMTPRREHTAREVNSYIPRQSTRRESRGGASSPRDTNGHEPSPRDMNSRSIQRRHHHKPAGRSPCSTLTSRVSSPQIGSTTSTMQRSELSRQLEVSQSASVSLTYTSSQVDGRESGVPSHRVESPRPRVRSGTDMRELRGFLSGMNASTNAAKDFVDNLEASALSRSRRRTTRHSRQ